MVFESSKQLLLNRDQQKLLQANGFHTLQDCATGKGSELQNATSTPQCLKETIQQKLAQFETRALRLIDFENGSQWIHRSVANTSEYIPTFCKTIDDLLGMPGIPLGRVIEIYGESGSGKSQFCFQLCVTAQITTETDSIARKVLYIDTERSFRSERILEIAQAITSDFNHQLNANSVLDNIILSQVNEVYQFNALLLYKLESFLKTNPLVKLIVIDSIAFPFRYDYKDDIREKVKLLAQISEKLRYFSRTFQVCILVVNQITFSLQTEECMPCLGEVWSHTAFIKLQFCKLQDQFRSIILRKSSVKGTSRSFVCISNKGIVDVKNEQGQHQNLKESEQKHQEEIKQFVVNSQQAYQQSQILQLKEVNQQEQIDLSDDDQDLFSSHHFESIQTLTVSNEDNQEFELIVDDDDEEEQEQENQDKNEQSLNNSISSFVDVILDESSLF